MDGFIIMAIIAAVINIYLLMDLIGSPIAQKSEAFMAAGSKWQQYKDMQDQTLEDLTKSAEAIAAISNMCKPKAEKAKSTAIAQDNAAIEGQKTDRMPHLTGILQVSGTDGSSRFIALMEGKRLHKNEKIMNFTIKNITAKGVYLSQNGQEKFIPAPEVYFSLGAEQVSAGAESR